MDSQPTPQAPRYRNPPPSPENVCKRAKHGDDDDVRAAPLLLADNPAEFLCAALDVRTLGFQHVWPKCFNHQLNLDLAGRPPRFVVLSVTILPRRRCRIDLSVQGKQLPSSVVLRAHRRFARGAADLRAWAREQCERFTSDETREWLRNAVGVHGLAREPAAGKLETHRCLDPSDEANRADGRPAQQATRYWLSVLPLHPRLALPRPDYRCEEKSLLPDVVLERLDAELAAGVERPCDYWVPVDAFKIQACAPWLRVTTSPRHRWLEICLVLRGVGDPERPAVVLLAERTLDVFARADVVAYGRGHVALFTGARTLAWLARALPVQADGCQLETRLDPTQTTRNADGSARRQLFLCPSLGSLRPLHPELLSRAEEAALAGAARD